MPQLAALKIFSDKVAKKLGQSDNSYQIVAEYTSEGEQLAVPVTQHSRYMVEQHTPAGPDVPRRWDMPTGPQLVEEEEEGAPAPELQLTLRPPKAST